MRISVAILFIRRTESPLRFIVFKVRVVGKFIMTQRLPEPERYFPFFHTGIGGRNVENTA